MRVNIIKDIRKAKEKLIKKAKAKGVYENFGDKEYGELEDKWNRYTGGFGSETDQEIRRQLKEFYEWTINADDNSIKKEAE